MAAREQPVLEEVRHLKKGQRGRKQWGAAQVSREEMGAPKPGSYLPLQQAGEAALLLLVMVLIQEGCRRQPGGGG